MSRSCQSCQRVAGAVGHERLLEIAEVLDQITALRADLYGGATVDDSALRAELFALLDQPNQGAWEKVREVEVLPSFFPGLGTPSPLGMTLGDIVYGCGLPDRDCPTRAALLHALRSAAEQFDTPMPG